MKAASTSSKRSGLRPAKSKTVSSPSLASRLKKLVENAPVVLFAVDKKGVFTLSEGKGLASLSLSPGELVGRSIYRVYRETPEIAANVRRALGGVDVDARIEISGGPGAGRIFDVHFAPTRDSKRKITGLLGVATDVTERVRAEGALKHQALHDTLTDLPNRALLHDRIEQAILLAERQKTQLALIVMDLDRFKEINDTFGHQAGDSVLRQVGPRLRTMLRRADTVARLGGDEFAILLTTVVDAGGAALVARKIQQALEEPFDIDGHKFDVSASIGIALYPTHGEDWTTLMRRADVAMYAAKQSLSGFAVYSRVDDPYSPSRVSLMGELRHGIANGELRLHYQPKIDLRTKKINRVEALVRWQHPKHGLLPPDQFIPLAERTGLMKPLSRWVIDTALEQCRTWHEAGLSIRVATNISTTSLQDPHLPEMIEGLLKAWRLDSACLKLEITESSIMVDPPRALSILTQIRDSGVRLSIDDFGTGNSSLAYLKHLPVDEIKIDKSFVLEMTTNPSDLAIVRSTIELGHNLGRKVVAEGVETEEAWDMLLSLGCDLAQGFYMTRPIPSEDLVQWIQSSCWSLSPDLPFERV